MKLEQKLKVVSILNNVAFYEIFLRKLIKSPFILVESRGYRNLLGSL
jgi:hypothetical protein